MESNANETRGQLPAGKKWARMKRYCRSAKEHAGSGNGISRRAVIGFYAIGGSRLDLNAQDLTARSSTDPVTNSVLFNGLDATTYLSWLGDRNLGASQLVPQFLHEFTHHWCFQTLLGATLALTDLHLKVFTESYPDGRPIWARNLVAHRYISTLLRPLAEGLAQLSEFDLTTKNREFNSYTPLGVASLCFSVSGGEQFRYFMIQNLRHSPELLERKSSLYLRKFEVDEGYLPGYMTVKNIAWTLVARGYNVPVEVLIAYLRSYFWDDPSYTNIIVSEEFNGGEIAAALSRRFRERLIYLFNASDLPEKIQLFWKKWSPGEPWNTAEELNVPRREFDLAIGRIAALEEHYSTLLEKDPERVAKTTKLSVGTLRALQSDVAQTRKFVVLASAKLRITKGAMEIIPNRGGLASHSIKRFKGSVAIPPGLYDLCAVVPTYGKHLILTATSGKGEVQVITSYSMDAEATIDTNGVVDFVRKLPFISATMSSLRDRFQGPGLAVVKSQAVDGLATEALSDALDAYLRVSAVRVQGTPSRVEAVRASLRNRALRDIFLNDDIAVSLISGMSMLSGAMQMFESNVDALLEMTHLYFLPDIPTPELKRRLNALVARDTESMVIRIVDDAALFFI